MKSIYELISEKELSFEYLEKEKLSVLFSPIINIKDIKSTIIDEVLSGQPEDEFIFSDKDKFDMIKFIAFAFSKSSPFQKRGMALRFVMEDVCADIQMRKELVDRVLNYKIPEVSNCIDKYLIRQDPDYRTMMSAKLLHDEFLSTCIAAIKRSNGEINYEAKKYLFDQSLDLSKKIYELDQDAQQQDHTFSKLKEEHIKEKRSLNSEDLITSV